MPQLTHQLLGNRHFDELLRLESRFPSTFRMGPERLRRKLDTLEETGVSLSWVILSQERVVAYIMAYPQNSRLEGDEERVLYIDDLFVEPDYQTCLLKLIDLFAGLAHEVGVGQMPVEAVCREKARKVFRKHGKVFLKRGWELSKESNYWDSVLKEQMYWLRWEAL